MSDSSSTRHGPSSGASTTGGRGPTVEVELRLQSRWLPRCVLLTLAAGIGAGTVIVGVSTQFSDAHPPEPGWIVAMVLLILGTLIGACGWFLAARSNRWTATVVADGSHRRLLVRAGRTQLDLALPADQVTCRWRRVYQRGWRHIATVLITSDGQSVMLRGIGFGRIEGTDLELETSWQQGVLKRPPGVPLLVATGVERVGGTTLDDHPSPAVRRAYRPTSNSNADFMALLTSRLSAIEIEDEPVEREPRWAYRRKHADDTTAETTTATTTTAAAAAGATTGSSATSGAAASSPTAARSTGGTGDPSRADLAAMRSIAVEKRPSSTARVVRLVVLGIAIALRLFSCAADEARERRQRNDAAAGLADQIEQQSRPPTWQGCPLEIGMSAGKLPAGTAEAAVAAVADISERTRFPVSIVQDPPEARMWIMPGDLPSSDPSHPNVSTMFTHERGVITNAIITLNPNAPAGDPVKELRAAIGQLLTGRADMTMPYVMSGPTDGTGSVDPGAEPPYDVAAVREAGAACTPMTAIAPSTSGG